MATNSTLESKGLSAPDLSDAAHVVKIFLEAGYDVPKLLELGHGPEALRAAEVPLKEMVAAKVPLHALKTLPCRLFSQRHLRFGLLQERIERSRLLSARVPGAWLQCKYASTVGLPGHGGEELHNTRTAGCWIRT